MLILEQNWIECTQNACILYYVFSPYWFLVFISVLICDFGPCSHRLEGPESETGTFSFVSCSGLRYVALKWHTWSIYYVYEYFFKNYILACVLWARFCTTFSVCYLGDLGSPCWHNVCVICDQTFCNVLYSRLFLLCTAMIRILRCVGACLTSHVYWVSFLKSSKPFSCWQRFLSRWESPLQNPSPTTKGLTWFVLYLHFCPVRALVSGLLVSFLSDSSPCLLAFCSDVSN